MARASFAHFFATPDEMDEVKGIKVIDRNTKYNIYADVVLVATGGFSANPEKLKKYTPGVEDIGHSNQIGAQGDFVDITLNHGIAFGHMDSLVVYPTLLIPRRDLTGGSNRPSILVNDQGKRFMDENIGLLEDYEDGLARVNILKEKTGGQSYFVFDQSYREDATMPKIQQCHCIREYILESNSKPEEFSGADRDRKSVV